MSIYQTEALVDFLNHGRIPFIGRIDESRAIREFWSATRQSHSLRAALLLGEAGSGKSRLVEEFLPNVTADGGLLVHLKLFPNSSSSIIPLTTRALRFSASASPLLKRDLEETASSVIASLQRLARLRPTLLVIEDIHLLTSDGLGDVATLVEALSGETLSLLFTARPVELTARGLLERYLVEEIELPALNRNDLELIATELFGHPLEPATTDLLLQTTMGNALALRSALRAALRDGWIEADNTGRWRTAYPTEVFATSLRQNIRLLSDGMTAHLSDTEIVAATTLASLGEVFSREAAEVMIDEAPRVIERLLFKGILVRGMVSVIPLPGSISSAPLLSFTHTLLHKHLVEKGKVELDRLLHVVADAAPLYSILPFQLLYRSGINAAECSGDLLRAVMDRAIESVYALERTSDGELGWSLREAIRAIAAVGATIWSEEISRLMQSRTIAIELRYLQHRLLTHESYYDLSDQLLTLTANPPNLPFAEMRVTALRHLLLRKRSKGELGGDVWDDVERLLERFTELRWSRSYIYFLQTASIGQGADNGSAMAHRVEERFQELIADQRVPEEMRRLALREVAPNFLWLFGTEEELNRRLALMKEVEAITNRNDIPFHLRKIALFDGIGRSDEVVMMIDDLLPRLREQGLRGHLAQCMLIRISSISSYDLELDQLTAELERVAGDAPSTIATKVKERGAVRLSRIGVMRGQAAWAHHVLSQYATEDIPGAWETRIIAAARAGLIRQIALEGYQAEPDEERAWLVQTLGDIMRARVEDRGEHLETLRAMLRSPMISRGGLARLHVAITLLEALSREPGFAGVIDDLRDVIAEALSTALVWLEPKRLNNFMLPLLDLYGHHLPPKDLQRWRTTTEAIQAERQRERNRNERKDRRLQISMAGVIEATHPGKEPIQLRGARLRSVVGLMVADRMLEPPLSYREFCRIASGGEDDPERARKMVNMALLRLREAIGDITLPDRVGDTPRLDPDLVEVDLLEIDQRLRNAIELAGRGSLMQALPLVIEGLTLLNEGIPFPTLYDEMFESLRADFEFRLRKAIIVVGGGVLYEGDVAGAEDLLRRGFEAIPEDEEIATLLCQALEQGGKRAEAGRVRTRIAEAEEL